jgi:hypothetical protein
LGEEYKSWSSKLRSFLHSLVTSSLIGPNILLNAGWLTYSANYVCFSLSVTKYHEIK